MIISLPFWLLSTCISLFFEKPKAHPNIAQAEQASVRDLKSLTAENLPVQSRNPADESGTHVTR